MKNWDWRKREICGSFVYVCSMKKQRWSWSIKDCKGWNQEDADKWLTIIQVPVEKEIMRE